MSRDRAGAGAVIPDLIHAEDLEWQLKGLCRGQDPNIWSPPIDTPLPERRRIERLAKTLCLGCPVISQCRQWALSHEEVDGVWGGLTERDREVFLRQLSQPRQRRVHRKTLQDYGVA